MMVRVVKIQMQTLRIYCCYVVTALQHQGLHLHHLLDHLLLTVPVHPPDRDLAFGPTLQRAGLREGELVEASCLMTQLW